MFMLDKESGAIRRERAGPNASAAITPGALRLHYAAPRGEVHSETRDETRRDGTGRASIKTASLRSLALVRLQRLSRKSSGCSPMHARAHCVVKGTRSVSRLRNLRFHTRRACYEAALRAAPRARHICTVKDARSWHGTARRPSFH